MQNCGPRWRNLREHDFVQEHAEKFKEECPPDGAGYHRSCYGAFCNITFIEKKRLHKNKNEDCAETNMLWKQRAQFLPAPVSGSSGPK